jgi:hypothetical protein
MSKLTEAELIQEFSNTVNNFSFDRTAFADAFKKEHRTLQQSMMRAMIECISVAASDDYSYDDRNKASHETCKLMIKGWKVEKAKALKESSNDGYWTDERIKEFFNENVKPSNLPMI